MSIDQKFVLLVGAGLLLILCLDLVLGSGTIQKSVPEKKAVTAKVTWVIDGDTIQVRFGREVHTVRLLGVDAPETKHPTKTAQYFGKKASFFTWKWLHGQTVHLVKDPIGDTRDGYGRLLRYVYINNLNFNALLVWEGYARVIQHFQFSRRKEFTRLEHQARKKGKGLWGRR